MFSFAIHVCSVLLAPFGLVCGLLKILEDPEAAGPPSGYSIVPIELDVPIDLNTPGSATVHLSGTIQDVVARMEKDYPGWNKTFSQSDEHYGALRQHIRH